MKKQRHCFVNKGPSSQSYGFSSSHVWMWELNYKESWVTNNWCFWTMVLENTLESPLDCKEIKPVHPKGNQSWILTGRTDAEAEILILWPPDAKNWVIGKDPDVRKDWRWEEKGMTEDEMIGWHHWLNGHEFELTPGVGDGQASLVCFSPMGLKESDTTQRHNWWLDLKDPVVVRGLGERKWDALVRHSRSVGLWNYFVCCYNGGYMSWYLCQNWWNI